MLPETRESPKMIYVYPELNVFMRRALSYLRRMLWHEFGKDIYDSQLFPEIIYVGHPRKSGFKKIRNGWNEVYFADMEGRCLVAGCKGIGRTGCIGRDETPPLIKGNPPAPLVRGEASLHGQEMSRLRLFSFIRRGRGEAPLKCQVRLWNNILYQEGESASVFFLVFTRNPAIKLENTAGDIP